MANFYVARECGHDTQAELFGETADRESKTATIDELVIQKIATATHSTVEITKTMIAKTNAELDAMIATAQRQVESIAVPTARHIEMLEGTKMAVALVKYYKALHQ